MLLAAVAVLCSLERSVPGLVAIDLGRERLLLLLALLPELPEFGQSQVLETAAYALERSAAGSALGDPAFLASLAERASAFLNHMSQASDPGPCRRLEPLQRSGDPLCRIPDSFLLKIGIRFLSLLW